ncbi:response regulator [Pontibacter liquoris]|uniref:response regulator n=1 Tax=Pontibacter liquoris TaxID=2905677 RepID=UPI001FA6B8C1|nr:response regulator [Pontibacter liquoris]
MHKITSTLLIDDDSTTNFVNRILLEKLEVTDAVFVARNGQEALQLIQTLCEEGNCPQLILLDINMPVMNGFDFLEAFNQLEFEQKESIVIVMLTTSLHPRDVEPLQEMPIHSYLNKPLTKEKVHGLLRTHFNFEFPVLE